MDDTPIRLGQTWVDNATGRPRIIRRYVRSTDQDNQVELSPTDDLPGNTGPTISETQLRMQFHQVPAPVPATLVEVATTPLEPLGFEGVSSINIELGGDRKAFVFTMSATARDAMEVDKLTSLALALGALVHPSSATLVVLPDGEHISAYRVQVDGAREG